MREYQSVTLLGKFTSRGFHAKPTVIPVTIVGRNSWKPILLLAYLAEGYTDFRQNAFQVTVMSSATATMAVILG